MRDAQAILRRVGLGLIEERRKGVEVAVVGDTKLGSSGIEGDKTSGRDLLSVLGASSIFLSLPTCLADLRDSSVEYVRENKFESDNVD